MSEENKASIPDVVIHFTPEYKHHVGVDGPSFKHVDSVCIEREGVFVLAKDFTTSETVEYFYPMRTVARVKAKRSVVTKARK